MKVFVLGGAGYIGSHVAKALLEDGNEVTVFDNLSSGLLENIQVGSEFIKGDILDYEALSKAMAGHDAIIHLAAFKAAGESMIVPQKYSLNNISGSVNILNAASENGIKAVVFSSSAATYGEPKYIPIDENHPQEPTNFYGYTKLEIEGLMEWYRELLGINYASLRYFNAAGYDPTGVVKGLEQNPANLIPVIMEVAVGKRESISVFGNDYDTIDGTGVRDYVHVSDLAEAHVMALHYIIDNNKSLSVNLGSESGISVDEMIETAREVTGKEIKAIYTDRRAGDPAKLVASSKKAKELLNWTPKFSDRETLIKSTWDAYKCQFDID